MPEWYRDAKFGIFIHWGVYSVPAFGNEWYSRNMYVQGTTEFKHHVATYGPHTGFGYKDFIPQLTGAQFDPTAWAELFRKAGRAMSFRWRSITMALRCTTAVSPSGTLSQMGPHRDVIGELAVCRAPSRASGLWSVHASPGALVVYERRDGSLNRMCVIRAITISMVRRCPRPSDHRDRNSQPPPSAEYLDDWYARTLELVDKYQPQVGLF